MSYFINGFVLPKMNMNKLLDFCKEHSVKINEIAKENLLEFIAKELVEVIDNIDAGFELKGIESRKEKQNYCSTYTSLIYCEYRDRVQNIIKTSQRDPEIDFETLVSFFPIKGKLLAIFYSEQPEINKYWRDIPEVKDYHIQNSTDKPENVTKKQWEQRKKIWDIAYGGNIYNPVYHNRFVYNFIPNDFLFSNFEISDLIKYIPSFEKRLYRLAKGSFINQFCSDLSTNLKPNEKPDYIRWYFEAEDLLYYKDTVAMNQLEEFKNKFRILLTENLTEDIIKLKNVYK